MPNITYSDTVSVVEIYEGGLFFCNPVGSSNALCNHATQIVEEVFENKITDISTDHSTNLEKFVARASKCKSKFTNDTKTKKLLSSLIKDRYKIKKTDKLLFDVPRLRIVPNSNFLSSGVSYNYRPHRDTWYGGGQDQINHWVSLANVSERSTFYIAPHYFARPLDNNSEIFDLDEWDSKYRKQAASNILVENRPHPIPLVDLEACDRYNIVLSRGAEVVFSGQHLHGSSENTTSSVRFSIDYRVCLERNTNMLPKNVDSRATGDYKKYMLAVRLAD